MEVSDVHAEGLGPALFRIQGCGDSGVVRPEIWDLKFDGARCWGLGLLWAGLARSVSDLG